MKVKIFNKSIGENVHNVPQETLEKMKNQPNKIFL